MVDREYWHRVNFRLLIYHRSGVRTTMGLLFPGFKTTLVVSLQHLNYMSTLLYNLSKILILL